MVRSFAVILWLVGLPAVAMAQMPVPLYRQCGESWSDDQLGTCDSTMCDAGCAVTSKAMIFEYYGGSMDPGELNSCLRSNGGYASGCLVYWNDTCAPAGTHYVGRGGLDSELAAGYPVLAEVRSAATSMHFVVITGDAGGGDYYINDPGWSHSTVREGGYTLVTFHNYHGDVGPPPRPDLEMAVEVVSIDGQERDSCGPDGIFDLPVSGATTVRVMVTNFGAGVGEDVIVGFALDEPALRALGWTVFDDWPGNECGGDWCPNDANENPDNPSADGLGASFLLTLGSLSPGESKRIDIEVEGGEGTLASGTPARLRSFVRQVAGYYDKSSYDAPPDNVDASQSWNGGELRIMAELDVLAEETCNAVDDDCDGEVDEGACGGDTGPVDVLDGGPDSDGGLDTDGGGGSGPITSMGGGCGCSVSSAGLAATPSLLALALLGLARLALRR